MTKFEFLDSSHPKQVKFPTLIHIQSKFQLSTTITFVGFQENIQQFIPQAEFEGRRFTCSFGNYS